MLFFLQVVWGNLFWAQKIWKKNGVSLFHSEKVQFFKPIAFPLDQKHPTLTHP